MTTTDEKIWDDFASQIRGFIRSRVRDHAAAEDLLQEVFMKIHCKLPTLNSSERLEAWIWRITLNSIADYFRKSVPQAPFPDELKASTKDDATALDLSSCVRRFVGELPTQYREALVLTE